MSVTLNFFDQIKIFRIDATDNHIKKSSLISEEGLIEVKLDEIINQVNLVLYSFDANNSDSNKKIYDDLKLNDINFNFHNRKSVHQKRIEIITKNSNQKHFHAVEFINENFYDQFKDLVDYLIEIYCVTDHEMTDFNNFEDVVSNKGFSDSRLTFLIFNFFYEIFN